MGMSCAYKNITYLFVVLNYYHQVKKVRLLNYVNHFACTYFFIQLIEYIYRELEV